MDKIPVSFQYKRRHYQGYLEHVSGAGGSETYHLMIGKLFCGYLWKTEHFGWQFASNDNEFIELKDYFVQQVEAARSA
jgi:hypothetical protein